VPHISMLLTPGFQFLALGVQAAFVGAISDDIARRQGPLLPLLTQQILWRANGVFERAYFLPQILR